MNRCTGPEAMSTEEFLRMHVFGKKSALFGATPAAAEEKTGYGLECFNNPMGKISLRVERSGTDKKEWRYTYDSTGHLLSAQCNDFLAEQYWYDHNGRRTGDSLSWLGADRDFSYDGVGCPVQVGNTRYAWDKEDRLAVKETRKGAMRFSYADATRVDSVTLPPGKKITYLYEDGLMPVEVRLNDAPFLRLEWENVLRLSRVLCKDGTEYTFLYAGKTGEGKAGTDEAGGRVPLKVLLRGPMAEALADGRGVPYRGLELHIAADQAGSIRRITLADGTLVKEIVYDSFGNRICDTNPAFFFPLGFACGLWDQHTGLTRFGFRDYDSEIGRFTAKDPLGDTGGDHDLYDYCVDDPVNMVDPSGLVPVAEVLWRTAGNVLKEMATPSKAGGPEEMLDVKNEILMLQKKLQEEGRGGPLVTNQECKRLHDLQIREAKLYREYKNIYQQGLYAEEYSEFLREWYQKDLMKRK